MDNLKKTMAVYAHGHSYTHNYLFGFVKDGKMWALWLDNMSIDEMLMLSSIVKPSSKNAARGAVLAFKGRSTAAYMLGQIRGKLECIGTQASYKADYSTWHKATGYNKGHYFEYVVAHMNGLEWSYNSTPGWIAGDLVIDGVHWQLKTNGGNFTTERLMRGGH